MANAIRHRAAMVSNENLVAERHKVDVKENASQELESARVAFSEKSNWSRKIAQEFRFLP